MKLNLYIPNFFVTEKMLGDEVPAEWSKGKKWQDFYGVAQNELLLKAETETDKKFISNFFKNMHRPFNPSLRYPHQPWKFNVPRLSSERNHKADPFSITPIHNNKAITQNIIYGSSGECIAQVDFEDHGSGDVHWHVLIPGIFDHSSGKNHAFNWRTCPWFWLSIPVDLNMQPAINPDNRGPSEISIKLNEYDEYADVRDEAAALIKKNENPKTIEYARLIKLYKKSDVGDAEQRANNYVNRFFAMLSTDSDGEITSDEEADNTLTI